MNYRSQTQFFTEIEKNKVYQDICNVMGQMKCNIMFEEVIKNLIYSQTYSQQQIDRRLFQRQEFLFGQVLMSLDLLRPSKMVNYMKVLDIFEKKDKEKTMSILT